MHVLGFAAAGRLQPERHRKRQTVVGVVSSKGRSAPSSACLPSRPDRSLQRRVALRDVIRDEIYAAGLSWGGRVRLGMIWSPPPPPAPRKTKVMAVFGQQSRISWGAVPRRAVPRRRLVTDTHSSSYSKTTKLSATDERAQRYMSMKRSRFSVLLLLL